MNKTDEYSEPKEALYVKAMVEELKQIPFEKRKSSTVQTDTVAAILQRDPSRDKEAWNRELDLNKAVALHPSSVERKIEPDEFMAYKSMQRQTKNSLGQSKESAVSDLLREKAIHAFEFSPPTELSPLEKDRITKLSTIKKFDGAREEIWVPLTPWEAFKHWVSGHEVKKEDEKYWQVKEKK